MSSDPSPRMSEVRLDSITDEMRSICWRCPNDTARRQSNQPLGIDVTRRGVSTENYVACR